MVVILCVGVGSIFILQKCNLQIYFLTVFFFILKKIVNIVFV